MTAQREHTMQFRFDAKRSGSFSSTFKEAQRDLKQFQQEYCTLSKLQSDVSAYQKQQSAIEKTQEKMQVLQRQYDNIQREIEETEGFSSDLENKLLSKRQQIERTTHALQIQTDRFEKYRDVLHEAGVNTENLDDVSQDLTDQLGTLTQKMGDAGKRVEEFGEKGQSAFEAMKSALATAGIARGLKEIYEWYGACTGASVEYESAITGVYKTVDGNSAQLADISEGIKEMSTEIPSTTKEIAAVGEAAGQLGIAADNVLDFTRIMIDLGESTNLTADEAATSLAKFSNITGTSASDYGRLGSVIVGLGNNFATTEADIVAMSTRLASAGTLAGLTEAEIMALATAMSSVGIEAEAGGTAMTQTLSAIETAVVKGEDDLQDFAEIAGMSAEDFSAAWEAEPIVAIQSFIAGLGELEQNGKSSVLVLDELGLSGVRQSNMLKSLGLASNTLGSAIGLANRAWTENVALSEEANKRYATTASQQAMMQNAYKNLEVEIGDNFTPTLQKLYKLAARVFSDFTEFVKAHPAAVKAITAFVAVFGGVVAVLSACAVVAKVAAAAFALLRASIPGLNIIMGLTAAFAGLASVLVVVTDGAEESKDEIEGLSAASKEQYYEVQKLQSEYDEVCVSMGETSAEAQLLKIKLDEATEAYEANRQTVEDLSQELKDIHDAYSEMTSSHQQAQDDMDTEYDSTLNLIGCLNELTAAEMQSASAKEKIKTIVDLLNERIPELGLNYDTLTGKLNMSPDDIIAAARKDNESKSRESDYQWLKDELAIEQSQYDAWQKAEKQRKDAQRAYDEAEKQANEKRRVASDLRSEGRYTAAVDAERNAEKIMKHARAALDQAAEEAATAQYDYENGQRNIALLSEQLASNSATTSDSEVAVLNVVSNWTTEIEELSTAYSDAYNAAYASINGQYALWDKAADVSAISVSDMNDAIQGQISYWQNYQSNIDLLSSYAGEIEGLGEMIASFADGSPDSVNAMAGMADALNSGNIDALRDMVTNWQTLQQEQKNTADGLAELETGYKEEMDRILSHLKEYIEAMNMDEEAVECAKSTIQAFIDQADDMLPAVQAAYGRLGKVASDALGSHTTSGFTGYTSVPAHANGTTYAEDAFIAGDNGPELILGRRGASVFPAQETQRIIDALPSGGNNSKVVEVHFAPVYHLEGLSNAVDLEAILRGHDEDMRAYIIQVLEEAGIDANRRAYV